MSASTLDAYGPVAGEVTIAQLAFKCMSLLTIYLDHVQSSPSSISNC